MKMLLGLAVVVVKHTWGTGIHFEIKATSENSDDYSNRKSFYSVNMQAIADTDLKFLDVSVGYPGSIHDSRVFSLSPIYQAMEQGLLMTGPTKIINDVPIDGPK